MNWALECTRLEIVTQSRIQGRSLIKVVTQVSTILSWGGIALVDDLVKGLVTTDETNLGNCDGDPVSPRSAKDCAGKRRQARKKAWCPASLGSMQMQGTPTGVYGS